MGKSSDLADQAKEHWGKKDWAENVKKTAEDGSCTFRPGDPKCNLFVYDMLYKAGISPPKTGIWPITAEMWTGSVSGWTIVQSQREGDVVSNGRHCGVAVDQTFTIAAGTTSVYKDKDIQDGTIQRYNQD